MELGSSTEAERRRGSGGGEGQRTGEGLGWVWSWGCSSNVAHADCIIDKAASKRMKTEQAREIERTVDRERESELAAYEHARYLGKCEGGKQMQIATNADNLVKMPITKINLALATNLLILH